LTGIEESGFTESFQLFPNPSNDKIILTTQGSTLQNLKLYRFDGKVLLEKNGPLPERVELDVHHLVPGIYFVELKQGEHLFRKKVIRE
jgi:hypothetical protein